MNTLNKLLIFSTITICIFSQNLYATEKIKIGLIIPLSGDNFLIGERIIKSIRMAVNKINDERIEIIPKDTKSNPIDALRVSKELYKKGVRIIIGPVFNESTKYLDDLKDVTFISFTNKLIDNPKNVISAGVNAISQLQTIKKFNEKNNLSKGIFLIPRSQFKKEIEVAINKTNIKFNLISDETRPTTVKQRFQSKGKTLLRVNELRQHSIDKNVIEKFESYVFQITSLFMLIKFILISQMLIHQL